MRSRVTLLSRALAVVAALALVLVTAPPSFAAPTLTISATDNLQDGQQVSISASGYTPNLKGIAIGQCIKGYKGPADCNISGGSYFRDADASGSVAEFTIVVKEKFGANDCTQVQCVIAGAPLPTAEDAATIAANTYEADITFGSAAADPAVTESTTAPTTTTTTTTGTELPQTGAGDSVPVLLLGAGALVAAGVGVVLLVPSRRREGAAR